MRDKSDREMKSSTDSSELDRQKRRTRRARGNSTTSHDGDLIDFSYDKKQNTMDTMQEDVEDSSNDASSSKDKSSIYTMARQAFQVIGLSPMHRGSPQQPHATTMNQQINTRCELEEEIVTLQKTCEKLKKGGADAVTENNQLRFRIKSAEDKLEKTISSAQKQVQRYQTKVDAVEARNESLKSDLETAEVKIFELEFEITTANEKLQAAEATAAEDISRLTSDIDTKNMELYKEKRSALQEIEQLQSKIKSLTEKNDKFRQMLIPVSQEQVLDATVVQKFRTLRFSIMALVRGTWELKLRDNIDVRGLSNGQRLFFISSEVASYDRLRYVVFHFIYQAIFNAENYFLEDGFERFEEHLQQVEKGLWEKSQVENAKLLMEWRNASFKVTDAFRGDGRRVSRATQSNIWGFLSPLQIVDDAAEAKGRKKLEEVCDAAIGLSLTIRQSRHHFFVDNMDGAVDQPISQWDKFTEEMATVPVSHGKQPGTIAYVIAGALIKNPKENMDMTLVLEKAEVAVYR